MKKLIFLYVLFSLMSLDVMAQKIKVACVGNSVTYGYGLENRERDAYPVQLQRLLGDGYEVANFGHSGTTLLKHGHRPYVSVKEYEAALKFAGDYVVIHLGLNDLDPRNWPNYRDEFTEDYLSLIGDFRKANPDCKIWICRMSPVFHDHPQFRSGRRDWFKMVQKAIENVAEIAHVGLIDLHTPLYSRPDLFADALHPNPEGAGILARTVYGGLTGDYGGLRMSRLYTDNMVLQRDCELCIAGMADRGEAVTVTLAGQKKKTVAGDDGKWSVTLRPLKADGKSHTLKVATPARSLVYRNVVAGEVWLCSGQSNMAFRVDESVKEEVESEKEYAAHNKLVRLYNMQPHWYTYHTKWPKSMMDSLNRMQYYGDCSWEECDPANMMKFSAIAFAFGRALADSLRVPVGLVFNAVGGACTESWIDRETVETRYPDFLSDWSDNELVQDWARGRADYNVSESDNRLQRHPYHTCYLYEAGILPIRDYKFKGVIWYQGESNAQNIEIHERLFPMLIDSWRRTFGKDLAFYYVQLSSLNRPSWCHFRDSQREMMSQIGHCGMAVSSDLGHETNIHPRRKMAVGERLSRWALNKDYGYDILPSGPLFRSVEYKGRYAYVSFDYGEGMRSADGGEILSFEVAEQYGLFHEAKAVVENGRVKVWSDEVSAPRYVRYGWQPCTGANLVNRDGLPASTFHSPR